MKTKQLYTLAACMMLYFISSIQIHAQDQQPRAVYSAIKESVMDEPNDHFMDSTNVFTDYDPSQGYDSLVVNMGRVYQLDDETIVKFDTLIGHQLYGKQPLDTLIVGDQYFIRNLHGMTESDLSALRHNLDAARSYKTSANKDGGCKGKNCPVYAHIDKGDQRLYLYLNGELTDTFKTSTARSGYETPNFDRKPNGRMYKKYSSHKYPGGSYEGLGNMPYAVFIEGGYAVHGATIGETYMLGRPASHGCVRIHPRNAKIFYNLVKYVGPENTWIHVTN